MSEIHPDQEVALLTVGHSTATKAALGALLTGAHIEHLVDVRSGPGSRRHPHVARAELEQWLPPLGISYRWDQRLGGFRPRPADSPDVALRNPGFAGYAAHMRTEPFRQAVTQLLTEAAAYRTAIMCAESMWWRCHRRMIADYVTLIRHTQVHHLMPDGKIVPHAPIEAARVSACNVLVYDAGTLPLES